MIIIIIIIRRRRRRIITKLIIMTISVNSKLIRTRRITAEFNVLQQI